MQKKTLPILFITLMLDMIGIGMVIPIIPVIFTNPHSPAFLLVGYSVQMQYLIAGLVTALFGLMQFFSAPILGELSDVYGRKRLLTVGVAVLAVSQMLFGLGIQIASIGLILFSRAVAGIAGGNFSIAQASIADVTDPKDRAKNFGLIGAAFGIGFILGPVLGGLIASSTGNAAAPFWCAGVLGIINMISLTFFLPETHRPDALKARSFHILKGIHNIMDAARDVTARRLYLASFMYVAGFTFFTSFSGIYLVARFGFSESAIGTFFGVIGIWIVITQLFILRVVTRLYNERTILRISLVALATALIMYPFMPSIFFLYALLPFLAVASGLSMANMSALVSKSVSADRQGAALGINGSLQALSQGVIPLLAGIGSGALGIYAPFLAAGGLVIGAWGVLFLMRR